MPPSSGPHDVRLSLADALQFDQTRPSAEGSLEDLANEEVDGLTLTMDRRQLIKRGFIVAGTLMRAPMVNLGRCVLWARSGPTISTRAIDLVAESRVIDMLSLLTLDWPKLFSWQRDPRTFHRIDYRRLERSGINVFHPAVETGEKDAYAAAMEWMAGWNHLLPSEPCYLGRVETPADLDRVPETGRIGVIVGFQDSSHFRRLSDVEAFYELGQRVSQLTYNGRNRLGDGCHVRRDRGLSRFGREVVGEMNRLGMAVDVSHCGERTSLDAIAASRVPVLVTHGNCRALVPGQRRCKSDTVIRQLARRGGVMGITMVRAFVSNAPNPTLSDLLDHFDHVAKLVGPEHVGLGSDTDVTAIDPHTGRVRRFYALRGLVPVDRVFQIADGLLGRGWKKEDVRLVLGANFERALGRIWQPASAAVSAREATRRDPFCPASLPSDPDSRGGN